MEWLARHLCQKLFNRSIYDLDVDVSLALLHYCFSMFLSCIPAIANAAKTLKGIRVCLHNKKKSLPLIRVNNAYKHIYKLVCSFPI